MTKLTTRILALTFASLTTPLLGQEQIRETQSLDGTWEIAFDENNQGRSAKWHTQDVFSSLKNRQKIPVPSCWEQFKQDYEGVAFYGKHFKAPANWKEKSVRLQFGAVNYIAEVWLNGYCVGRHEGGYGNFEFLVNDLIKPGKDNFLSLRVLSPIVATDQVIDGLGANDAPHWRGAIAAGIWQSVQLVASGKVFIDDTFVIPQLKDNTAKIKVALDNTDTTSKDAKVEVSITSATDPAKVVATKSTPIKLLPGKNKTECTLAITNPQYWSPNTPHLYTTHVKVIENGRALDLESTRFGMRELTIRNKQFELNGKKIFIKAAFFEGLYPNRLAYPDSPEMARREIQLAKDAGFNMIRPWRKPPPPMWLDLCDEMGVMVVGGLPIECMKRWPTVTPEMPARIENEVRSAIGRDRNRACIVQWEIFNEIWRTELKRLKHPISMLARQLDPSRLILDESGGYAGGANIYLPYQFEPEKFNDVHSYPGAPLSDKSYNNFITLAVKKSKHVTPGLLTNVSEIGYGSLPDLIDNNQRFKNSGNPLVPAYRYHKMLADSFSKALKDSGLDAVYPDLKTFCIDQQKIHSQGNKRMIEAIRSNPRVGGYCVHALTGGDWVTGAGLLDLFRNPKESYWGTKEANQPRYLALRVMPRNVYAEMGAKLRLLGINDLETVNGSLVLQVTDSQGNKIIDKKSNISLNSGITQLIEQQLDTSKLSGAYQAKVVLTGKDGKVITKNTVSFDVYTKEQLKTPSVSIAVLDPNNTLKPHLKRMGVSFTEFNASTPVTTPVYVGKIEIKNNKAPFKTLETFVRKGGTAVYLEHVLRNNANPFWTGKPLPKAFLPIKSVMKRAMGLWVGVSHVVTDHPVFTGLPNKQMMGQAYENVYSTQTLIETGGTIYAGSVSHGFYGDQDRKQHHMGPEPGWAGIDIGEVAHGKGRYILSGLRLMENLGKDPVADKILINLLTWTNKK